MSSIQNLTAAKSPTETPLLNQLDVTPTVLKGGETYFRFDR